MLFALMLLQTAAVAPAPDPAPAAVPQKKLCRTIDQTGSRLGSKRVCRTQAQWDAQDRVYQNSASEIQARARGRN